jgi:hypothetical protein
MGKPNDSLSFQEFLVVNRFVYIVNEKRLYGTIYIWVFTALDVSYI